MARELLIVWAGRRRRDRWEDLVSGYRKRIERSLRVHDRPVKVSSAGSDAERRRDEADRLLRGLPEKTWTIALDRSGKALSSLAFARALGALIDEWQHPIAFLLGSDVGLDSRVLAESRQVLSFGPMTFPHELARLVLYEQLYRAVAIRTGINYHR